MTDAPDHPASEAYTARLETPTAARRRVDWLLWPTRMVGAALGVLDEPSFGDVVVRRVDDATEALRLPVTGSEETGIGLAQMEDQLQHLTVAEFEERWGLAA